MGSLEVNGLAGLAIILIALAFGDSLNSHIAEVALTMTGSVMLTRAHLAKRTFCRKCSRCEH